MAEVVSEILPHKVHNSNHTKRKGQTERGELGYSRQLYLSRLYRQHAIVPIRLDSRQSKVPVSTVVGLQRATPSMSINMHP
jgi:hypothetical protein